MKSCDLSRDIVDAYCEASKTRLKKNIIIEIITAIETEKEYDFVDLAFNGIEIDGKTVYIVPDKYLNIIPIDKERNDVEEDLKEEYGCDNVLSFDGFGEYSLFYICW